MSKYFVKLFIVVPVIASSEKEAQTLAIKQFAEDNGGNVVEFQSEVVQSE